MKSRPRLIAFLMMLMLAFGVAPLTGCDRDGPMEEAGEEMDEMGDDIEDEIDDRT